MLLYWSNDQGWCICYFLVLHPAFTVALQAALDEKRELMKQWMSDQDSIHADAASVKEYYALRKVEDAAPKPFDLKEEAEATVRAVNQLPESERKDCARKLMLRWHPGEC